jgi:peptidoglycan/xylan/chitin deacetylase (PgdA/CDA1 family)
MLFFFAILFSAALASGPNANNKHILKCLHDGEALITFDGGPTNNTQKVLATLKKENVTGAFFLTSQSIDEDSGTAKHILDSGHIVGYRFEREWNLTTMSDEGLYNSIERRLDNINRKIGKRPRYLRLNSEGTNRFTIGEAQSLSDAVMTKLIYAGYVIVGAQVDAKDGNLTKIGFFPEPFQAVASDLGKLSAGDSPIIRLHETNWLSATQALHVIEQAKGKGLKLVNFTQCMGSSGPYFDEKGKIPSFYGDYPKLSTPPEDEGKIFSAQNGASEHARNELWALLLIMLYAMLN